MGLGGVTDTIRDQSKAPTTNQFLRQDPSISTESSRQENPYACFSVLGVQAPARPVTSMIANDFPNYTELA